MFCLMVSVVVLVEFVSRFMVKELFSKMVGFFCLRLWFCFVRG